MPPTVEVSQALSEARAEILKRASEARNVDELMSLQAQDTVFFNAGTATFT